MRLVSSLSYNRGTGNVECRIANSELRHRAFFRHSTFAIRHSIVACLVFLAGSSTALAQYPTYTEIGNRLLAAQTNYPALCQRFDLGTTVLGRSMWALCISDNVGVEEDEPEFRYISTMHGDEVTGVEMCLRLIDDLTTNYGTDSRVTNIVDSVELWIVPCMNLDGYVAGNRYNNHGVDLNRDFPDPFTSPANSGAGREPETANIMNWAMGRSFTLAANYHGGALVANYPFDTNASGSSIYTPTPDDNLFVWISEEYSQHNLPMWNSPYFYHGTTNGADWYAIFGGMQDWSYLYMGTNELTIEVSQVKTPSWSQMPTFWSQNRESMLTYIETCLIGARGIVTDAYTGLPVAAGVTVQGRDHAVYTDPDVGDYHRMLLPGTYSLTFDANRYDPLTVDNVQVTSGDATRLDVDLWRTILSEPNGGETLTEDATTMIRWTGSPDAQFQVQYTMDADLVSTIADGFESGILGAEYSTGGNSVWTVNATASHQGSYAARSGNVSDNQSTWMTRTVSGGPLSFWYLVSSEANYDFFNFYIDGDNKISASGNSGAWTQYSIQLASGTHELKWEYSKDSSVSSGSDAAWIDDLENTADHTIWSDVVALTPVGASSTSWSPAVSGDNYKVRVRSAYGAGVYGPWDESDRTFAVGPGVIPTVSQWGLAMLALLMVTAGTLILARRQGPVGAKAGVASGSSDDCLSRANENASASVRLALDPDRKRRRTMGGMRLLLFAISTMICSSGYLSAAPPTRIHVAAASGDVDGIEKLVAHSPGSVNTKDAAGYTPLHLAVRNLRLEASDALLLAGADILAKDRHGASPLHLALGGGLNSEKTRKQRESLVKLLLADGANPRAVDDQGKTPLHVAAMKGHHTLIGMLLDAGADVEATDKFQRTPLHDAAMYNQLTAIDQLLASKADLGAKDKLGDTPLHCAVRRFRKEASMRLLAAGAKVNARNLLGATPLHLTGIAGPQEKEVDRLLSKVAEVLLDRGAQINARDEQGHTPLHYALGKKRPTLAATLRNHNGLE